MELYILNLEVQKILEEKGIKAYRTFVGNYCTSIDMTGASVTLMKLDDELKELLDAPCDTPALKEGINDELYFNRKGLRRIYQAGL